MFELVADVERYPEFVPHCEKLAVTSRNSDGTGTVLTATMSVGYKVVKESFTTRVRLDPTRNEILVEYLDGPFSHLENRWKFSEAAGGTDVDFFIDYDFRSYWLALVVGGLFNPAVRQFAKIFEERARRIYGSSQSGRGT